MKLDVNYCQADIPILEFDVIIIMLLVYGFGQFGRMKKNVRTYEFYVQTTDSIHQEAGS